MKQSRLELRENYERACNAYLMAFCEKHGFDYADAAQSWVGGDVSGITLCADYYEFFRFRGVCKDCDLPF